MPSSAADPVRGRRRLLVGSLVGWLALGFVVRQVVLLPERCPAVTVEDVDRAAAAAVGWFRTNQADDGSWLYRYRAATDDDLGGYNIVRHAGVMLSLYQAAARGVPGAGGVADRGLAWARQHVVAGDGWLAFGYSGQPLDVGATALLVAALVERRSAPAGSAGAAPERDDELLSGLGRFLVAQLEPSGAVPERWDPATGRPSTGAYSRFSTGETFWALARLEAALPAEGWAEPALLVGRYLASQRDRAEGRFPPVGDHWAAYGLAEVRRWPDGAAASAALDPGGAYARRLGALLGVQVRYESQRTDGGLERWTRGPRTLGAALGTIGEAESNLWDVAGRRPELAGDRATLARRAGCVAGMLVERQVGVLDAAGSPSPTRVTGAWFHHGVTQMDDQQHGLSALLLARPVVAGAAG